MSLDRRALVQLARLFLLADGVSGVVGMAGEDGERAVYLLGEHDPGEFVGQRDGAKREHQAPGGVRRLKSPW